MTREHPSSGSDRCRPLLSGPGGDRPGQRLPKVVMPCRANRAADRCRFSLRISPEAKGLAVFAMVKCG